MLLMRVKAKKATGEQLREPRNSVTKTLCKLHSPAEERQERSWHLEDKRSEKSKDVVLTAPREGRGRVRALIFTSKKSISVFCAEPTIVVISQDDGRMIEWCSVSEDLHSTCSNST